MRNITEDLRRETNYKSKDHEKRGNNFVLMCNGVSGNMVDSVYGSITIEGARALALKVIDDDDVWMGEEREITIVRRRT